MPHFVIDCSKNILAANAPKNTLLTIHNTAVESGLFDENDIKVRFNSYEDNYIVGGKADDFIHVFANIMEGRTAEQKAKLSREIIKKLKAVFPNVEFIAINIRDFEKATYCNKSMV